MKSILFSGVHGVGKGFFLDKVKPYIEGYKIYSASALIEKYKKSTDAGYKKVRDVKNNQDVLIKAIQEVRYQEKNCFILDGHLCVFDSAGEVVRIPEYFFIETGIEGIILLQDYPQVICDRISERDSNRISVHAIRLMQKEEKAYAKELNRKFKIPYMVITHECTEKEFIKKIQDMGGDSVE